MISRGTINIWVACTVKLHSSMITSIFKITVRPMELGPASHKSTPYRPSTPSRISRLSSWARRSPTYAASTKATRRNKWAAKLIIKLRTMARWSTRTCADCAVRKKVIAYFCHAATTYAAWSARRVSAAAASSAAIRSGRKSRYTNEIMNRNAENLIDVYNILYLANHL